MLFKVDCGAADIEFNFIVELPFHCGVQMYRKRYAKLIVVLLKWNLNDIIEPAFHCTNVQVEMDNRVLKNYRYE